MGRLSTRWRKAIRCSLAGITLLLYGVHASSAEATTISFTGLTDNTSGNGEITGNEFDAQGILFSTTTLALNVGCTTNPCLGADKIAVNDFLGTLVGTFVVPSTAVPTVVSGLNIDFCCEANVGSTNTRVYGPGGALVATFADTDVSYGGGVSRFEVDFGVDAIRSLSYTPSCGNGAPDADEQCDDGNTANGDCCDSSCQYESNGSPCDDATVCNGNETCDGAGTCLPGTPPDCDDGNACTADSCDPLSGCVNDEAPAGGCLTSEKSILVIKDKSEDSNDRLLWKWIKGAAVSQMDFADPTSSDTYALCVYAGTTDALIANAAIPPGTGWSALGSKRYKFKGTSPNGLTEAILKGGDAGKSKALAKGKGTALPDPALPLAYPVTVQLKKDSSPLCLESTFTSADEKKNDETQFRAKH